MLGIILMMILNATLYVGMTKDMSNALNIAAYIMWALAILQVFAMLITDEELLKKADNHFLYVWSLRTLVLVTVTHSVYWGYFWAPSVLLISSVVLWLRKYELNNRKRF